MWLKEDPGNPVRDKAASVHRGSGGLRNGARRGSSALLRGECQEEGGQSCGQGRRRLEKRWARGTVAAQVLAPVKPVTRALPKARRAERVTGAPVLLGALQLFPGACCFPFSVTSGGLHA